MSPLGTIHGLGVVAGAEVVDRDLAAVAAEDERARVRHPLGVRDAVLVAVDADRRRRRSRRRACRRSSAGSSRRSSRADTSTRRRRRRSSCRRARRRARRDAPRTSRRRPSCACGVVIVCSGRPSRAITWIGPVPWTAAMRAVVGLRRRVPAAAGGQLHLASAVGVADHTLPWSMYTIESAFATAGSASAAGRRRAGCAGASCGAALPRTPCPRLAASLPPTPNWAQIVTPASPVGVPRRTPSPSSRNCDPSRRHVDAPPYAGPAPRSPARAACSARAARGRGRASPARARRRSRARAGPALRARG